MISYDELLKDEAPARATMRHWLEGAGAASPSSGLAFVRAESGQDKSTQPQPDPRPDADVWPDRGSAAATSTGRWLLNESEFRELDYTHAGGYDSVVIHDDAPNWSARLRPCRRVGLDSLSAGASGTLENTLIHLPGEGDGQAVRRVCQLAKDLTSRVTVIVDAQWVNVLEQHGFRRVLSWAKDTHKC